MVIVISLYNLSIQSSGLGCHGHFHFSLHIANFVDKNWRKFFPSEPKRKRKNLLGTIASVLSQHSPKTFTSGTDVVGSIGWWKLKEKWTPREYEELHQNKIRNNIIVDGDAEETESKKARLMDKNRIDLENSFLDTKDGLIDELNKLKEELSASCSMKAEESTSKHLDMDVVSKLNEIDDDTLNTCDEQKNYEKLKKIIDAQNLHKAKIPQWILDYFNKLRDKKTKGEAQNNKKVELKRETDPNLLDKHYASTNHLQYSLLSGPVCYDLFHSPYTNQVLHPFIYCDKKIFPRWLKLMCEIKYSVNGEVPARSTIDFCYVKPHHIPAVNSLLQTTFWPGIDMSDSLNYPDFTIIALYKKLVIGCAFLIPDACHNEAYISYFTVRHGWDRSGIGSFMLYHLTQTSHGKDIKLHVSASNPAVCLYQKFGFKTEELELDFYEKFLSIDSPHSPHALLLRLTR